MIGIIILQGALFLIPLSIGFSILRYRLYDIDVLINRTLVYGSLTALLALLYFGLIFALQSLFQGMFHQNNAIAIVVSTLALLLSSSPCAVVSRPLSTVASIAESMMLLARWRLSVRPCAMRLS